MKETGVTGERIVWLCDTNILAELARPRPNPGVLSWAGSITRTGLSAVTLEEIRFGLAWKPNARISAWFERFLGDFCQVLPITEEVAVCAGNLRGVLQASGKPRTQADMLIAATVAVLDCTLVTRNTRDFGDCGINVLNPFS